MDGQGLQEPLGELMEKAQLDDIREQLRVASLNDMYRSFDEEISRFVDANVEYIQQLEYAAEYAIKDAVAKHKTFLPVVSFSGEKTQQWYRVLFLERCPTLQ